MSILSSPSLLNVLGGFQHVNSSLLLTERRVLKDLGLVKRSVLKEERERRNEERK